MKTDNGAMKVRIDNDFYTDLNCRLKFTTIRKAAKVIGTSPATLSRVANGAVPDLDTFVKVCHYVGYTIIPYIKHKP